MRRTAHRRAAGRAAPTGVLPRVRLAGTDVLTRVRPTQPPPLRLFSVAGQVVTAKRARLDPTTVTLLVFLHEAIPGGVEREAYDIIEGALAIEDSDDD